LGLLGGKRFPKKLFAEIRKGLKKERNQEIQSRGRKRPLKRGGGGTLFERGGITTL